MRSDGLPRDACRKVSEQVASMLAYLGQLRERMDRHWLAADDPLRRDPEAAYDRVHAPRVNLHYLACGPANAAPASPAPQTCPPEVTPRPRTPRSPFTSIV